jgi:uncharacterized membrane protein
MSLFIFSLSYFLHILATVVWIGGIVMILLVILPSATTALESAPKTKLMTEITRRFTPMANISILVLVATGIVIAFHQEKFSGLMDFNNSWSVITLVKHVLVALMIIIHFYRGLILNPKIGRLSSERNDSQVTRLQRFSLDLVKTNLVLGMMVLLLTGISSSL